jgi:transcriptional/translational regulatory protein YebC/TACO1
MMVALEAGADDFNAEDGLYEILCPPTAVAAVRKVLEDMGIEVESAEIRRIPQNTVSLDAEGVEKIERMLERFEDSDDVQEVYHNAELPEQEEE